MGAPQWWVGPTIRDREGNEHGLDFHQAIDLVRVLQVHLDTLTEFAKLEGDNMHLETKRARVEELLEWLRPHEDSEAFTDGYFAEVYKAARGQK